MTFYATSRRLKRARESDLLVTAGVQKRDRHAPAKTINKKAEAQKANARALRRLSNLQQRADRRGLKRDYFKGFKPVPVPT